MACPKCGSLKAKVGSSTTTLLAPSPPTRDENGIIHSSPDPNIITTYYVCLKCGTSYTERRKNVS